MGMYDTLSLLEPLCNLDLILKFNWRKLSYKAVIQIIEQEYLMKMFIALLMLSSLPMVAVAGPEEHMYESCYTATTVTPSSIPSTFCLDYLQLDSDKTNLYITGNFSNFPEKMKITNAIFSSEDRVKFVAESTIVNIWNTGCGDGETATLSVGGVWDIMQGEQINPKALKIKVSYESTNDTCHSQPQTTEIDYILSK